MCVCVCVCMCVCVCVSECMCVCVCVHVVCTRYMYKSCDFKNTRSLSNFHSKQASPTGPYCNRDSQLGPGPVRRWLVKTL